MTRPPFDPSWGLETRLVRAGRTGPGERGAVNPPIQRGSTLLLPDVAALYGDGRTYGLDGFEVQDVLAGALADMVGAAGAVLVPSGLAACTIALLSVAQAGRDVLVTDAVYGPTRRFCDGLLARAGVRTRYFAARASGSDLAAMIDERVCAVFLESPASLTMEVQDTVALAAAARASGVATIIDDTWSAGVYANAFDLGVDISVQAVTKYQAGHADALLGAVLSRNPDRVAAARAVAKELGIGCGAPEDAYLALRGLRTMPLRLARQSASALEVARWLDARPEVSSVLHPALPTHPDHALFLRDFTGSAGVFSVVLRPARPAQVAAMLDGLRLFGLGFSWGGYESLVIPCDPQIKRTVAPWTADGPLVRFSIGLENPADLIADLAEGFERLRLTK